MHETAFLNQIIRVINNKTRNLDANSRITGINVKLSPLSHVKPEALRSAFLQTAKANGITDILLNINPSELELRCKSCGSKFSVKSPQFTCPHCKSSDFEIRQEHEFFVESVEIEKK